MNTPDAEQPPLRKLHAAGPAELAARGLREQIYQGRLLPGKIFSLTEIADEAGCRSAALVPHLRSLEADGLILVRRDVAMIRPLNSDELCEAYQILRLVGPHIIERALGRLTTAELAVIKASYPDAPRHAPQFLAELRTAVFDRTVLLSSKVSTIERSVLASTVRVLRRYYAPVTAYPQVPLALTRAIGDSERELCDRFPSRELPGILEAFRRSCAAGEPIGHHLVTLTHDPEAGRRYTRMLRRTC